MNIKQDAQRTQQRRAQRSDMQIVVPDAVVVLEKSSVEGGQQDSLRRYLASEAGLLLTTD